MNSNNNKTELKPFDKVLVRKTKNSLWKARFFDRIDKKNDRPYLCQDGKHYLVCVPYTWATEHLYDFQPNEIEVYKEKKNTNDKEIHFYMENESFVDKNYSLLTSYTETKNEISNNNSNIHTLSLTNLSFDLLDLGYRIFLHQNGKVLEAKPGMECIIKDIRREHNILKMWLDGVFDTYFIKTNYEIKHLDKNIDFIKNISEEHLKLSQYCDNCDKITVNSNDKNKEIHFYYDLDSIPFDNTTIYKTFNITKTLILEGKTPINTTSISNLSFDLLDLGYRIFLHQNGKVLEAKPGMLGTDKEVKKGHNISKLWLGGTFDDYFKL